MQEFMRSDTALSAPAAQRRTAQTPGKQYDHSPHYKKGSGGHISSLESLFPKEVACYPHTQTKFRSFRQTLKLQAIYKEHQDQE